MLLGVMMLNIVELDPVEQSKGRGGAFHRMSGFHSRHVVSGFWVSSAVHVDVVVPGFRVRLDAEALLESSRSGCRHCGGPWAAMWEMCVEFCSTEP